MNKRMLLTFVLCAGVMIGFELIIFSPQRAAQQKKLKAQKQAKAEKEAQAAADAKKAKLEAAKKPDEKDPKKKDPDKTEKDPAKVGNDPKKDEKPVVEDVNKGIKINEAIEVTTAKFNAVFSTEGASLRRLTFNDIDQNDRQAKLTILHDYQKYVNGLAMTLTGDKIKLDQVHWNYEKSDGQLTFWRDLGNKHRLEKIIEYTDNFHFNVKLRFINDGKEVWNPEYSLNGPAGMLEEYTARAEELQGVVVKKDPQGALLFDNVGVSDVREAQNFKRDFPTGTGDLKTQIMYIGLNTKYFASLLMPVGEATNEKVNVARLKSMVIEDPAVIESMVEASGKLPRPSEDPVNQMIAQILSYGFEVPASGQVEHTYMFFCGPKSTELVYTKPYEDHGLYKLRDYGFGFFATPARVLASLLGFFHNLIGNYGIAILILTLLVKALLHPLTRKSQTSMHMMQKLAPEIQKIKDKYEGKTSQEAKQKMTMETMGLYSKYGVNPVAGCLPIFIQMPLFFALYNVLNYTYELRHAKFFSWIDDLSQADYLFELPFTSPFHGTNVFSVLPIVMLFLYIANQRMTPKSTDPKQAETQKIMKFMLPMFAFLFYTVPSGLLLYFITSMSVGIGEQFYIKRMLKNMELKPASKKKGGALAAMKEAVNKQNNANKKKKKGKKGKK
ncbi:MAG: membrane protein insertase YidC [Planctomycetota bacterium]|nr:membrane protein insertase YidC [Planctomycetota bacterium]